MAKKQEAEKVRCIECLHSELMQWDKDPIIAKCPLRLYRQVANTLRICKEFEPAKGEKHITKYTNRL